MIEKIENFFSKQLLDVQNLLILKTDHGYELFNRYCITLNSLGYYVVTISDTAGEYMFYNLQNAVTWCIYENRKKRKDIKRIQYLDNSLGGLEVSMQIHRVMLNSTKPKEDKGIIMTKLSEETLKRSSMKKELGNYIRISKIWQSKLFAEMRPKL